MSRFHLSPFAFREKQSADKARGERERLQALLDGHTKKAEEQRSELESQIESQRKEHQTQLAQEQQQRHEQIERHQNEADEQMRRLKEEHQNEINELASRWK